MSIAVADASEVLTVRRQFYLHKLFDVQSDMEFLPYMPHEHDLPPPPALQYYPYNQSQLHSAAPAYRGGSTTGTTTSQMTEILKTPKSRQAFLNSQTFSPKPRTAGNVAKKRYTTLQHADSQPRQTSRNW